MMERSDWDWDWDWDRTHPVVSGGAWEEPVLCDGGLGQGGIGPGPSIAGAVRLTAQNTTTTTIG